MTAARLEALLDQGLALAEIAEQCHCSVRTVRNVGNAHGVAMPAQRRARRTSEIIEQLEEMRTTGRLDGRPATAIAAELGIPAHQAAKLLTKIAPQRPRGQRELRDHAWLQNQIDAGATTADIAARLDVSREHVRNALDAAGIARRHRSGPPPRFALLYDDDWLTTQLAIRSRKDIAAQLGCSPAFVTAAARRVGMSQPNPRYPQLADRTWLWRRYIAQRRTQPAIAAEIGCSEIAVQHALKRHGLMPRPPRRSAQSTEARYSTPYEAVMAQTERRGDCIVFVGRMLNRGGSIRWHGRDLAAHRVVIEHHRGPPPPGMTNVCHSCDNAKRCVNIDHLTYQRPGAHDHHARGQHVHGAKLTPATVIDIRARRANGDTYTAIAQSLGISKTTARAAALGTAWAWIDPDDSSDGR